MSDDPEDNSQSQSPSPSQIQIESSSSDSTASQKEADEEEDFTEEPLSSAEGLPDPGHSHGPKSSKSSKSSKSEEENGDDDNDDDGPDVDGLARKESKKVRRQKQASIAAHMQQELMKQKIAQAKQDREDRKNKLDTTHIHLLETVSNHFDLSMKDTIEFVLDSPRFLDFINSFLEKGGSKVVFFCYQFHDPPGTESGRTGAPSRLKKVKVKRLLVTDGTDIPLMGEVVYFIRITNHHKITMKNVAEDTLFGVMNIRDPNEPGIVIESVHDALSNIYLEYLKSNDTWVPFSDPEEAESVRHKFVTSVEHYSEFLAESKFDISSRLDLRTIRNIDDISSMLKSSDDVIAASKMPDIVNQVEQIVSLWCKHIEKVLAVSISMRKEAEVMGPLAETAYWRNLMAKMSFIIQQMNEWTFVSFIQILAYAKSKVLKRWRNVESRVNDQFYEAKDNVKYMYALEKFCHPLYQSDPPAMIEHIPSLIYTIRLIHTSSRYYNTCEKVTALMVKISNQMIRACRRYITKNGTETIWHQDKKVLVEKLRKCIELYQTYKKSFDTTKAELAKDPQGKQFTFSESHIFGRFEKFCARLKKIIQIVEIFDMYRFVHESHIRGIDVISTELKNIQRTMEERSYDPLEFREEDFDLDYIEIRAAVDEVQKALEKFMDDSINRCPTAVHGLELLERFKNLRNRCLDIKGKEWYLFQFYHNEIQMIKSIYDCEKNDTPIPRGFPPFAGKLAWARHLFRRLERPMTLFKEKTTVLSRPEAKPTIKLYNSVAKKLVFYEIIFHDGWIKQTTAIYDSLEAPLLTLRGTMRQELVLNFDPFFRQIIEETEIIRKLDLEIPDVAQIVYYKQDKLFQTYEQMKGLLERFLVIKARVPSDLVLLIRPTIKKVEKSFMPGIANVNWTSFKCEEYFNFISANLQELELLISSINDIIKVRINQYLWDISHTIMIDIPDDRPVTVEEYMDRVRVYSLIVAKDLEYKSRACETAVIELINILLASSDIQAPEELLYSWMNANLFKTKDEQKGRKSISSKRLSYLGGLVSTINSQQKEDLMHIHEECRHVFNYYSARCVECLQKATRVALENLRKRSEEIPISAKHRHNPNQDFQSQIPLFHADLILAIPTITLRPRLEEIQEVLTRSIQLATDSLKMVVIWGQSRRASFDINTKEPVYRDPAREAEDLANALYPRLQTHQELVLASMQMENVNARLKNCYRIVMDHKEIGKLFLMMQNCVLHTKSSLYQFIQKYLTYSFLWKENREDEMNDHISKNYLVITEIEAMWKGYETLEHDIQNIPNGHRIGPLQLNTEELKSSLEVEVDGWKTSLCQHLHDHYRNQIISISRFIEDSHKELNTPINDMHDIYVLMTALERIRENFVDIDAHIQPIEEIYNFLANKKYRMSEEDFDKAFALRGEFIKLQEQAQEVTKKIANVQMDHKKLLQEALVRFKVDLDNYLDRYHRDGPQIDGLTPQEASDRLFVFQDQFDQLHERYIMYHEGEKLFGLKPQEYPQLDKVRRELIILQRIYGLYNDVIHSINGYYDIRLALITKQVIDKMVTDMEGYETRCRFLPPLLREWPAYRELRLKMDQFYEILQLLDLVEDKSVEERDWILIEDIVGTKLEFDKDSEDIRRVPLKVIHIYEAKLQKEQNVQMSLSQTSTMDGNISLY